LKIFFDKIKKFTAVLICLVFISRKDFQITSKVKSMMLKVFFEKIPDNLKALQVFRILKFLKMKLKMKRRTLL